MGNTNILAKLTAFRDIAEECKREGGQNYVLLEKEICEALGIIKPDFRQFNGNNKAILDYGNTHDNDYH